MNGPLATWLTPVVPMPLAGPAAAVARKVAGGSATW